MAGWSKRKPITITGGASGAQTDFQLKLTVAYDGDMQSDFDDLRFTQADGTTLIDAWLETKTDDTSATVWAEFPTTPANTVTEDYYMYYGNSGIGNYWNLDNTFIFGDDFEDNDVSDWVTEGSNTFVADAAIKKEGSYSGKSVVAGVLGDESYKAFSATTEAVFEFDIRFSLNTSYIYITLDEVAGSYLDSVFLRISSDGSIVYYDGSYHSLGGAGTIVADQWYEFKIVPHATADTFDFWIDGVSKGTGLGTRGNINTGIRAIASSGGGTSGGIMYFDNIFQHKYAANPATYGFGAEQSAPTDGNPFWYYNMLKRRNS